MDGAGAYSIRGRPLAGGLAERPCIRGVTNGDSRNGNVVEHGIQPLPVDAVFDLGLATVQQVTRGCQISDHIAQARLMNPEVLKGAWNWNRSNRL